MHLGIDVGTSEVKAVLLDDDQHVLATGHSPLKVLRPKPGHSEQDPAEWWRGVCEALREVRGKAPSVYSCVRSIGLTGQMHGAVILDECDRVLRPAILWNDTRSHLECGDLMKQEPRLSSIAGSLAMPGFTAPKLLWIRRHEPALFARTRKVLLPKDYVRLKLTGEYASDMSDASGTMWLDVRLRQWSELLLSLTGLGPGAMPNLVEGSEASGELLPSAAAELGLRAGIPVAGGAGDNAASAVGMGCISSGQGFISLGTSGVTFIVTDAYRPDVQRATHAFCHAVPRMWHQMAVMLSAASALDWAARAFGRSEPAAFEAEAAALELTERSRAPIFLPYLSGERTPHNDAGVRGSLHGLDHDTNSAEIAYAVLEGVTFGLTDGVDALCGATGRPERLSLVGGGSRSRVWAQLIASALDLEVVTHVGGTTGAALGAARLGALAVGRTERDMCTPPPALHVFVPNELEREQLESRRERFRSLYRPIKPVEA